MYSKIALRASALVFQFASCTSSVFRVAKRLSATALSHQPYYKHGRSPDDLDLVITDVRMPVMSGLEVFKGLRIAHWTLPVIVMTAYATDEVRDATQRYGATLLIKPLDLDELETAVRQALAAPRPPSSRPR